MTDLLITTDELAEIRARVDAATEGPWHDRGDVIAYEAPAKPNFGWPNTGDVAYLVNLCPAPALTVDAEFIAHARTDVPRLLDAVEAVLKVLDGQKSPVCLDCMHPDCMLETDIRWAIRSALGATR